MCENYYLLKIRRETKIESLYTWPCSQIPLYILDYGKTDDLSDWPLKTYSSSFLLLTWRTPYESLTMFPPIERSHIHKRQARLYPIPLLSHRIQCPCPKSDTLSVKSCCSLENAVLWHTRDHIREIHLLLFLLKLQAHKLHTSKEKNGPDHSRLPIELTKLKNKGLIALVI